MDNMLTPSWSLPRREAYVKSRREKYPYEIIVTCGMDPAKPYRFATGQFPNPATFARHHNAVVFICTPMPEKSVQVWQFMTDDEAETFMAWWRQDCVSRGEQPSMRLDRHGEAK